MGHCVKKAPYVGYRLLQLPLAGGGGTQAVRDGPAGSEQSVQALEIICFPSRVHGRPTKRPPCFSCTPFAGRTDRAAVDTEQPASPAAGTATIPL